MHLTFEQTLASSGAGAVSFADDLLTAQIGGKTAVIAVDLQAGILTVYELLSDGSLSFADQLSFGADSGLSGAASLAVVEGVSSFQVLITGQDSGNLIAVDLSAQLGLGVVEQIDLLPGMTGFDPGLMIAVTDGGSQYVYTLAAGGDGVSQFLPDAGGFTHVETSLEQTGGDHAGAAGFLENFTVDGQSVILAGFTSGDSLQAYTVGQGGDLQLGGSLGAADGLGINAPTAAAGVELATGSFAVVASTLSNSLTVLKLLSDGTIEAVDHVTDSLNTRFADVSALAVVNVGGRALVFAAGSDDGITVLELLPTGHLILQHVITVVGDGIGAVTSMQAHLVDGAAQLITTDEAGTGLSSFSLSLQDLGQVVQTSPSGAGISGTAGEDALIISHAGQQVTTGGGADKIVIDLPLGTSGLLTEVMDFNPQLDSISLPEFVFLRSASQLEITPTADGAVVAFLGAEILFHSHDGQPLFASDFADVGLFDLEHQYLSDMVGTPPDQPVDGPISGTSGDDILQGTHLSETISGAGGNDTITSGGGDDTLLGGGGNDMLSARDEGGAVSFDGGGGHDVLLAGEGSAVMEGGAGLDLLVATQGQVTMTGGADLDSYVFLQSGALQNSEITNYQSGEAIVIDGSAYNHNLSLQGGDLLIDGLVVTGSTAGPVTLFFMDTGQIDTMGATEFRSSILAGSPGESGFQKVTVDTEGTQDYWMVVETYSSAGELAKRHVEADDGTAMRESWDVEDAQSWDSRVETFTENDELVLRVQQNDDGSTTTTQTDLDGTKYWVSRTDTVDAQGRKLSQQVETGDGLSHDYQFDVDDQESWAVSKVAKTAQGDTRSERFVFDDGTQSSTVYDTSNAEIWASLQETVVTGDVAQRDIYFDNGERELTVFDITDSEAWDQHIRTFDAQGNLVSESFV